MPIGKYFGGHGDRVMAAMQKQHGTKAGTREFYATANKQHQQVPKDRLKKAVAGMSR